MSWSAFNFKQTWSKKINNERLWLAFFVAMELSSMGVAGKYLFRSYLVFFVNVRNQGMTERDVK